MPEEAPKAWYESRTLWFNLIAGVAVAAQAFLGFEVIPVEAQEALLVVVNIILRLVTRKPVAFS
jgi:hypothetical protein